MHLSPLKSAQWLLQHSHVKLLDCRYSLANPQAGAQAYAAGHLPGAVYADLERHLSGPKQPSGVGGRHPLPSAEAFAAWLGSVGIGNGDTVVCYDDPAGGLGMTAARAWWLLRYFGHRQAYVLDGGLGAYVAAGGTLSTEVPMPTPQTFVPDIQADYLADAEAVQGRAEGVVLIDSRAPERYRGETEPLDAKAGHIPGAINCEWSGALDEQGFFLPPDQQTRRLGVGDAPTITYCGSGVSAAPNVLARELAGVALGPDNRMYAGSWSDWISDPARPVATG